MINFETDQLYLKTWRSLISYHIYVHDINGVGDNSDKGKVHKMNGNKD